MPVGQLAHAGSADALVTDLESVTSIARSAQPCRGDGEQFHEKVRQGRGASCSSRTRLRSTPTPRSRQEASLEARDQGKFGEMHEKLFANRRRSRARPRATQRRSGLKRGQFKAALDTNKHKAEIDADQKLARDLGASGTPSFSSTSQPTRRTAFDAFKTVIDEELAKAKQLVAAVHRRPRSHAKLTENGATAPIVHRGRGCTGAFGCTGRAGRGQESTSFAPAAKDSDQGHNPSAKS